MSNNVETILVSGGAGYIGSHTILELLDSNKDYKIIVVDNMSTGSEFTKKYLESLGVEFIIENINEQDVVKKVIKENNIKTVFNFAGYVQVEESVRNPIKYYENNYSNTLLFVKACIKGGVERFIFSSTASIYGNATIDKPVNELAPTAPTNAYATSKLMVERSLKDINKAHPSFNYGVLRYFNVAGADTKGRLGQMCKDATHIFKVSTEKALGLRDKLSIYGTDYPTHDGTCVRDYIHINDLAKAHINLMDYMLENPNTSDVFNCGYGKGFSVKDVVESVEKASGVNLNAQEADRRPGDAVSIVADATKIKEKLGWIPKHDDINKIAHTALEWEKRNLN